MTVATLTHNTQHLTAWEPTGNGVRLTLADGRRVCLDAAHPAFRLWMIHVDSPLRDHYPLGVVTDDAGWVVDLSGAHDTSIYWLRESVTAPGRFEVACWGFAPIIGLSREHPDFDRIHTVLTAAAGTRRQFWVTYSDIETVDYGPDEDGFDIILPKILDVRPVV